MYGQGGYGGNSLRRGTSFHGTPGGDPGTPGRYDGNSSYLDAGRMSTGSRGNVMSPQAQYMPNYLFPSSSANNTQQPETPNRSMSMHDGRMWSYENELANSSQKEKTATPAIPNTYGQQLSNGGQQGNGAANQQPQNMDGAPLDVDAPPTLSLNDDQLAPPSGFTRVSDQTRRESSGFVMSQNRNHGGVPSHMYDAAPITPDPHNATTPLQLLSRRTGHAQPASASPSQRDPFYRGGPDLSTTFVPDERWVTVFGFPPDSVSYILKQFQAYGEIVQHVVGAGNWMHVCYQNKVQAMGALSKNGKVYGNVMIGVTPCVEPAVMNGSSSTPAGIPATPSRHRSYQASRRDYEVDPFSRQTPQPQKSIMSKAGEYLFGW